jgi:DNA polymerase
MDSRTLDALDKLEHKATLIHVKHSLNLGDVYVPGEGASNAKVFIFGEAPGAQEEMQQRPFVGPAGNVLRDLMDSAGLSATPTSTVPEDGWGPNCWLTNVVKFRPPRNRTPVWQEIALYRPLLHREWLAVGAPRIIIPVGSTALTAVYGSKHSLRILDVAGTTFHLTDRKNQPYYLAPMIHPSFGLRNPEVRPMMERHWSALGDWLDRYHK